jgi:hypothetical protein
MYITLGLGHFGHIEFGTPAQAIGAVNAVGLVNSALVFTAGIIATGSQEFALAQRLEKRGFSSITVQVDHVARLGDAQQMVVVIDISNGSGTVDEMKVTLYPVFPIFYLGVSV